MDIASVLTEHVLPHWPLIFMALVLGTITQFTKRVIFEPRKADGKLWKFGYVTMGAHAPLMGAIAGLVGFPVSPGVDGVLGRVLYHIVSGILAAWVVAGFKHFMKSRGIEIEQ